MNEIASGFGWIAYFKLLSSSSVSTSPASIAK